MKKIDVHAHAFVGESINFYGSNKAFASPEEVLSIYKRIGVGKGVLLPVSNVECGNRIQSNEDIMDIVSQNPDTFYWFCNIDPRMGQNSKDADLSYYLEYYKERGAKGVGEVQTNMYFDDPYMENLFYHCQKNSMPLLFHMATKIGESYGIVDECGLPRLEKELAKFPDLVFIGHSPSFWSNIGADLRREIWEDWYYPKGKVIPGRIVELMRKYPNLYGEISAGSGNNAMLRDPEFSYEFLEEFQDQVLFGTDICDRNYSLNTSSWLDDVVNSGKISEKAYQKVSRDNALKLMGLMGE